MASGTSRQWSKALVALIRQSVGLQRFRRQLTTFIHRVSQHTIAKFSERIFSKSETAQVNEVLVKVLCWNFTVLIRMMHELGITPEFVRLNDEGGAAAAA